MVDKYPKTVWIIQAQENPAESRFIKGRREWRSNTLSETLADKGHDVVRWRSAFSHQSKSFLAEDNSSIKHDNYTQRFIACPPYKRHVGLARILNHRALGKNFLFSAQSCEVPDLIHVGNVPIELCYSAVSYGKKVGCPVIVDIRDLWPDSYVDFLPEFVSFLKKPLLKILTLTSFKLKWAMQNAYAITAMTQPFLDWGLALANRSKTKRDKVFTMCYPRIDDAPSDQDISELRVRLNINENDIVACFLGNLSYQCDFDLLINAAKRLSKKYPNFKIVIAGSGPYEKLLEDISLNQKNFIFAGWLDGMDIKSLLYLSKIGLVPYKPSSSFLKSISNKYPEYLAGEIAIACGLSGEMARLTKDNNCGFVYESGNVDSFCSQLTKLLDDTNLLNTAARNAKLLHSSYFDSLNIYKNFADHLEEILETY